jgi:hypothetical protein
MARSCSSVCSKLFRASHLAHHRWLNTDAEQLQPPTAASSRVQTFLRELEMVKHLVYVADALAGRLPLVHPRRIIGGFCVSLICVAIWFSIGRGDVIVKMLAVNALTLLVPVSLRAAVEHHSHVEDVASTNEYRVWLPLFNLNRHIHHHEEPRCPWYRLEWRTADPLPQTSYLSHWYRVHIRHDFRRMPPPFAGDRRK